jgi:DNA polymerase III delta prime subunit
MQNDQQRLRLGQGKTLAQVHVAYPLALHEGLPTAQLTATNGSTWQTQLPPEPKDFFNSLQTAGVPYDISQTQPTRGQRLRRLGQTLLGDTVLPLLVLTLATAPFFLGYGHVQRYLKGLKLRQVLQQARVALNAPAGDGLKTSLADTLKRYSPEVQDLAQRFQHGQLDALLAEGPPGTGKTHLMDTLARASHGQGPVSQQHTLVLDIGGESPERGEVRGELLKLFNGDEHQSREALQAFRRINGGQPVRSIVAVADEIENIAPELDSLLTEAMGNPHRASTLPRFRLLATCNRLPTFSEATKNRISAGWMFVDHPHPKQAAMAVSQALSARGVAPPPEAATQLEALFQKHPGYSLRRVMQMVDVLFPETRSAQKPAFQAVLTHLDSRLAQTRLDDTEIAGLLRRETMRALGDHFPGLSQAARENLNMQATLAAENASRGLDRLIRLNGQGFQRLIGQGLALLQKPDGYGITLTKVPDELNEAVGRLGAILRERSVDLLA